MRQIVWGLALLGGSSLAHATVPMGGLAGERLRGVPGVSAAPVTAVPAKSAAVNPVATRAVLGVGGGIPAAEDPAASATVGGSLVVGQTSAVAPEETLNIPTVEPVVSAPVEIEGPATPAVDAEPVEAEQGAAPLSEADAAELAEYERLFGTEDAQVDGQPVELENGLSQWIWPILLLGVIGTWLLRKRLTKGGVTNDDIRIVGRASLGREGSLAVVQVEDSDGQPRRLLVGYGGGAPRLVADLAEPQVPVGWTERSGPTGRGGSASSWERAFQDADEGLESKSSGDQLIADVLADRDEVRKNLGELPAGGRRAGVRRRAYRGTMA